jgi:hypothetical protein
VAVSAPDASEKFAPDANEQKMSVGGRQPDLCARAVMLFIEHRQQKPRLSGAAVFTLFILAEFVRTHFAWKNNLFTIRVMSFKLPSVK